jgi:hypothetical protein
MSSNVAILLAADKTLVLSNILPWLILLIGLTLAGGVLIYFVRRSLKGGDTSAPAGFTLQDLRDMHAAGEISDAEFERARSLMINRLRGPVNPDNSAVPPGNQESSDQ